MNIKSERFDGIVICSTQNQMVNYLTIIDHFDRENGMEIVNLTFADEEESNDDKKYSKFDNVEWDKSLNNSLKEFNYPEPIPIIFDEESIQDHETIINELTNIFIEYKHLAAKRFLWNITGGQRHLVMAITKFLSTEGRDRDVVVYYEGNQKKFYYYSECNGNSYKPAKLSEDILYDRLNLNIAFKLMGFEADDKTRASRYYKFLQIKHGELKNGEAYPKSEWEEIDAERRCYSNLYEDFVKTDDLGMLNILKPTNKIGDTDLDELADDILSLGQSEAKFDSTDAEIFKKTLKNCCRGALFGYVFEYMVFYKIIDVLLCEKNQKYYKTIADIHLSAKASSASSKSKSFVDEFDISILMKSGQMIIFECKSGYLDGDDLKSHHYSTYAVSGVYGTPILIIPFTKAMEEFNGEKDYIIDCNKKKIAAEKARVEFWYLNDIKTRLIERLEREAK